MNKKNIVITGCSSGFGRVTSLELARRGWQVFATVRKDEDRADLLAEAEKSGYQDNLIPLLCDITQCEQVAALKQQVEELLRAGLSGEGICLDALLNNAGTAFGGPIELLSLDDLRAQMEINVIAHVGVTQAFLPMLKAGGGTIINVSSLGGRISTPMTGAYAASKFALEAISDALRIELAPFGIRVAVIEPSSSPTNIWETSLQRSHTRMDSYIEGPYRQLLNAVDKIATRATTVGFPPQLFADTVVRILESSKPRARYPIPSSTAATLFMYHILPTRVWDYLVRRTLKW